MIVNASSGSRTIIHTNLGLPELSLDHFTSLDLTHFSWIHLEGRNREVLLQVLQYLNKKREVKFSVEVEKVNRGFEDFIPYGDVVFVSKVSLISIKISFKIFLNYIRMWQRVMDARIKRMQ